jgi:hypothetical protein
MITLNPKGEFLMVERAGQRRFRVSTRTLMVAVALCALLLVPDVWTLRRVEALRNEVARVLVEERAVVAAQAAVKLGTADQKKAGSIWAGLSVNHPIFKAGQTKDLRIEFSLVNDSDKPIDPKITKSQILINGKELTDSASILSSFPKGGRSNALSPGESLQFDRLLGDQFKEPGIYRVSWKGADFHSPEIVLRILPDEAR